METSNNNFVHLKETLTAHGLKATMQRLVIYNTLLTSFEHPTAEEIFDQIKNQNPSISLGTVYKTLDSLVECGLAKKVKTQNDVFHFDAKIHSHSHLYCTRTNRILDFEDPELQDLLQQYFEKKNMPNFKVTDFQVQINGELVENINQINNK